MKMLKKLLAVTMLLAVLMTTLVIYVPQTASAYDNNYTFTITGTNTTPPSGSHNKVYLYTNTTGSTKTIKWSDYNFRDSKLMIFDNTGRVIECGGNITSATSPITGAPQLYLYIPAGGFMVAFGSNNADFMKIYNVVMEGAMLYNSTMSVIYEAYASYSGSTLTVKYNNPKAPSANAKKFLFIGNSTTYFNGGPIKFKAMAAAAGIEVDVTYCTRGSAYLSYFVDETNYSGAIGTSNDHNTALKAAFASKKFDYVVLQDAAKATYYTSHDAVEKLVAMAKANGATPVLYMRYSADTTLSGIIANAEKHHYNYATLAKEFGLDVAQVADAFIYAKQSIPNVELYASDGGHHSKEGSYLMAATWLYKFLGVDPVGNSYTAQMSSTLATQLQQCAKKACEEEYVWPVTQTSYTASNGTSYKNIAAGKDYVPTGSQYSDYRWTDSFPDYSIRGKLTDGKKSTKGDDTNIGTYNGSNHTLTIDLLGTSEIKAISTDLFGSAWGITDPGSATISVSTSNDGKNFTNAGTLSMSSESNPEGEWKKRTFSKEFATSLSARYVRLSYSGTNFAWSSEIEVFGVQGAIQEPQEPQEPIVPDDDNIAYQKTYSATGIYAHYETGEITYPDEGGKTLTDGIVADTTALFDDSIFVGFNGHSDDYVADGYASVTVDFGSNYKFNKLLACVATLNQDNKDAGVLPPTSVEFYVSTDKTNWTKAGSAVPAQSADDNCTAAILNITGDAIGRYVQYRFYAVESWMMVSEVKAYGEKYTGQITPVDPPVDDPVTPPVDDPVTPPADDPVTPPVDDPIDPPKEDPVDPPKDEDGDYMLGDINESGEIDSMDYILLKRNYFGTYKFTEAQLKIGDINENNEIDSMDYILLKRAYFGTYEIK